MNWRRLARLGVENTVRVVALGTVPQDRRPSSSTAWLLLLMTKPLAGLPLFLLVGSPFVRGRRLEVQMEVNDILREHAGSRPALPPGVEIDPRLESILGMDTRLTGLPVVTGTEHGFYLDTFKTYAEMTAAVREAKTFVHVEYFAMAWDDTTAPFFEALADAVQRGVKVRLLLDHLGSRKYPNWREFQQKLTDIGVEWHLMMPIKPLEGKWRRPDLRNHRKLMVIDGERAFMGSANVIDPSYDSAKNKEIGRQWHDFSVQVSGDIVLELQAIFATDWYIESGERLDPNEYFVDRQNVVPGGANNALQLVPSGPSFPTEPNLALFVSLVYYAQKRISIASPYFVPDESLLRAITSAARRGVEVELFVSEESDQFIVGHAQRSYYRVLLEAGVRIYLYPKPQVLHTKFIAVDGEVGVIGSSNMDFRSFALDYEIVMVGFGGDWVDNIHAAGDDYRSKSRELTLAEWTSQPWTARYVDNVCRLSSVFM